MIPFHPSEPISPVLFLSAPGPAYLEGVYLGTPVLPSPGFHPFPVPLLPWDAGLSAERLQVSTATWKLTGTSGGEGRPNLRLCPQHCPVLGSWPR